jgi:ABC-type nitrate/sulfonate/bicarbonate transport system permease component
MRLPSATEINDDRRARVAAQLAFLGLFLAAWETYGRLKNPLILPPATQVAQAFWDLLSSGRLIEALLPSLQLLGIGFVLGTSSALILGVLIGRSRVADLTFSPYLAALYATPSVALVPIILVWFGFGTTGKVIVVFESAFFPMLYNVTTGVRAAPTDLIDVAKSFGASRLKTLMQVILPSAIPFIFVGLQLAIGRAVVGMSVAEVYLRLGGIGGLITTFGSRFITDYLIAAILVLPALGIALTRLVGLLERRIAPWRTV